MKSEERLECFINKGVEVLDKLPEDWVYTQHTNTAPNGYKWANNRKSIFKEGYKSALIKISAESEE